MPHERTLPKAKTDRLELLRATRANLDPIWGLSLAAGLSALLAPGDGEPDATAIDDDGFHHSLWRVDDPDARSRDRRRGRRRAASCWPTATTASRPPATTGASAEPPGSTIPAPTRS